MTADIRIDQMIRINQAFKPRTPIDKRSLFAGRHGQVDKIIGGILQVGSHVILYGERGVGKTSLVSVLDDFFVPHQALFRFVRVNCDNQITFAGLWMRILDGIRIEQAQRPIGFDPKPEPQLAYSTALALVRDEHLSPDDLRIVFSQLPAMHPIIVIDEIDRVQDKHTLALIADTIKALSDHASKVTLILVGVADSVDALIGEHGSIERALVQIQLPRMSPSELKEALEKSLSEADMTMDEDAKLFVIRLSRGLPHYTHLLGLHAALRANYANKRHIALPDVDNAIHISLENTDQSIRSSYVQATHTTRRETMHQSVLLACALAEANELGFFTASDVRRQLGNLLARGIEVSVFARHLTDFASEKRGSILQRVGKERQYRYRFINPLMQPYIIMKGIEEGLIAYEEYTKLQRH